MSAAPFYFHESWPAFKGILTTAHSACYIVSMKIKALLLAFLIPLFVCTSMEAAAQKKSQATKPAAAENADDPVSRFQQSKDWNKLTSSLQQAWLDAMKNGDTKRRLDCFVKVRDLDNIQGDESFLDSQGFDVQMWSGSIARGHMNAGDLPGVAAIPFVDSINLAKPPSPSN